MNVIKQTDAGYVLYNPKDEYVGRSIEHYGDYQREELKLFSDYVKGGDTVLDIGANIGTHTLWFANRVGSKEGGRIRVEHGGKSSNGCLPERPGCRLPTRNAAPFTGARTNCAT